MTTEPGDGSEPAKPSRLAGYLTEHNISARDAPLAVAVHEGIGIGILIGCWAGCYSIEPTRRFAAPFASFWPTGAAALQRRWEPALAASEKKIQRWLPRVNSPGRCVVH